ncbi:MAG: hypothetical protein CSYNP_02503 [Syntrophus sp. SKADARSKE-3]|nr:hypothetical protein [Syntrophus sp. SKADARSKE-3]
MMKCMIAVTALFLCTCVAAQAGYRTEVTVTPYTEAHQYAVQFKIMDVADDGQAKVLAMPFTVLWAGKEGTIEIFKEKENEGCIFCTALVKETEDDVEAVTTVVVKENGTEKLSTAQSIKVNK